MHVNSAPPQGAVPAATISSSKKLLLDVELLAVHHARGDVRQARVARGALCEREDVRSDVARGGNGAEALRVYERLRTLLRDDAPAAG